MRFFNILLYIIFSSLLVSAQKTEVGVPKITNYPPKTYGYESQNYSVISDDKGYLYAGNLNGILVFDGKDWTLIDMQGGPILTKTESAGIYAGIDRNFGVIKNNSDNSISFSSITKKYPKKFSSITDIVNVKSYKNDVLIQTNENLYLWNNDIHFLDYNTKGFNMFKLNNNLFINKIGFGIYTYKNNKLSIYNNSEFFKKNIVESILQYSKDKLLIKIKNGIFYLVDNKNITPFQTNADFFFSNTKIITSENLTKNRLVFGTERCGLVLMSKEGKILSNINKETGLLDDQINDIFVDKKNQYVWIASENGISRIDIPSVFSFYGESAGIGGSIQDIIRYNNNIYVATRQGVFVMLNECIYNMNKKCYSNEKFQPVENVSVSCNKFYEINNNLFVTSKDGLYKIGKDNTSELILNSDCEKIISLKNDSNTILISNSKGIIIAKIQENKIVKIGDIKKINKKIRTIAEDEYGNIWAGTDNEGLFKINLTNEINVNAKITSIISGQGLPKNFKWIDVYKTQNGILFSTFKGVYRFNYKKNTFYKDTIIGFEKLNKNSWVFPINEDKKGNLWFSSGEFKIFKKTTGVATYNKLNKTYSIFTNPFNLISDITIESIYTDKDSTIWVGTNNQLIRVDIKQIRKQQQTPKIFFKQIIAGKDSIIYNYVNLTENLTQNIDNPILKYSLNNIKFMFASPNFRSGSEIEYSYKLEGYDKDWSEWSTNNSKEYTNLSEGEFAFMVRSKDILNNISDQITYKFKIKAPFYRKWYAYIFYLLLLTSFVIMIIRYRSYLYEKEKQMLENEIAEKTEEIVRQKEKAELLIKKLLPEDTAKEIQTVGRAKRKKYEMATVLFSDIQGFTKIAEHMSSETLLDELDRLFLKFDELVEKRKVEKIKTIGDAYMCAGGIPVKNLTNAIDVVLVAMEIREFMSELKKEALNDWEIRIGIHTGPIIAGVVGTKKLSYDIWGDTVNIASRMESSGMPGEINISEETYMFISEFFDCVHRGKLPVKYKGNIDMYFVKGIRSDFSIDGNGKIPNEKFLLRYQQIKFRELEDIIYYKLENALNPDIKYHNLKHTVDVVNQAEIIGRGENITSNEMMLLKTAALFHDLGFVLGYNDHEESGVKMAKEMLPEYGYTQEQIKTITELIYATKFPPKPENKLEQIICDADLDYLGRPDFLPVSIALYEELFKFKQLKNIGEWNKRQVGFLEKHQYYTETARQRREVNKNIQLEKIKQWLEENKDN